jgi:hypothetical protein
MRGLQHELHGLPQEVQIPARAQRVEQVGEGRLVEGHRGDLLREPLDGITPKITRWPLSRVDPPQNPAHLSPVEPSKDPGCIGVWAVRLRQGASTGKGAALNPTTPGDTHRTGRRARLLAGRNEHWRRPVMKGWTDN